jgi:prepilin peptidase CpaA
VNLAILLTAFLPALLVAAAVYDLATYTIPNFISAAMFLLFAMLLAVMAMGGHPLSLDELGFHLLAGSIGLVAGAVFFMLRWVGGGDAKLFAAAALWLGWDTLFDYALLSAMLGGALTLGILMARQIPLPRILVTMPWLARLTDRTQGVPYGVALAIAALNMWPATELFHLAVMR